MNKKGFAILGFFSLLLMSTPLLAKIEVFACEPEWAALAKEIGGDQVNTFSATTPHQDPHFIQARPSLIARVRRADLVICTGANLEIGWLPVLLKQAGNNKVNAGGDGFLDASQYVRMLEVPGQVDRAAGDIHPYGNPHFQTDARNIGLVADALADHLVTIDPDQSDYYAAQNETFQSRWNEALANWQQRATPLRNMKVVVHHRAWVYLENWLGLNEVAALEPKPGLPPTATHLAGLLDLLSRESVRVVIRSAYQPARASEWLTDRVGVPNVVIPQTVGATKDAENLFDLYDVMIDRLLEAAQ